MLEIKERKEEKTPNYSMSINRSYDGVHLLLVNHYLP